MYIKPVNESEPWFWGELVSEIDAQRSVWTYRRLEPIEKEFREREIIALPELDELLPGNLLRIQ